MDDFEQQLKQALARKDPPAWFDAKVMAAVAREPERRRNRWWTDWFTAPRLRWATAGLATVVMVGGVAWERERAAEERVAGEQAKAKLELALKITGAKLRQIEARVSER